MDKHSCAVIIDGIKTDICITPYRNRLFIIVTQYEKLGSMLIVQKESNVDICNHFENYTTKNIFGHDNEEIDAASRFIAEQIKIDRPMLLSISLKNYDPKNLRQIAEVINKIKSW